MYIKEFFASFLLAVASFSSVADTVAHWQFNGNVKDSGPSGLIARATKAEFVKSKSGQALTGAAGIGVSGKKGFEKLKDNFTIKAVFKVDALTKTQQAVIWKRGGKPTHGFLIQILNSKPLFCMYDAKGKQYHLYGPKLVKKDLGKWITLMVTYDGKRLVMLMNGLNVGERKLNNIVMDPGKAYLFLGSAGSSRILQGAIDEILITDSATAAPSGKTATAKKKIKKVVESAKQAFKNIPGALCLNFSSPYAKPFTGFERVDINKMYGGKNKYGWIFKGARGEKSEPLFQRRNKNGYAYPDNLTGTAIHFRGGKENLKFQADVKPGKYIVVLYLNAFADGSKVYNLLPYKVYINGKKLIDRKVTKESFFKRFYRGIGDEFEWRPGTDIWKKYLKNEVNIYKFPVTTSDGKINFEFQMESRNFGKLTGLLSLNGLIIAPAKEKVTLDQALGKIVQERRRQFYTRCEEKIMPEPNKLPKLSNKITKLGYVPFSRYFMKQVFPNTVPLKSEIEKPLSTFAAQGQRQIATFSLYPLKTLKKVKIAVSDLKSASGKTIAVKDMGLLRVRYIEEPLQYRKIDDYSYMPLGKMLVANKPFTIEKGITRRYMLEVNTPANTAPGEYSGTIKVKPENAPEYSFKVNFKVYPFKLESYADDDERIWIYHPWGQFKWYGGILWDDNNKWKRISDDVAMMKKYSIAPTIGFNWFMTDDELKRFMAIYMKHNFRGLASYGGYSFLRIVDRIHKTPGKHGNYSKYINRMKEVEALRKKHNWPKFAYYTTAEIHNGMPGYLEGKWAIDQMKKAAPEATLFCLPNHVEEFEVLMDSKVDIMGPNAISMREEVVDDIKDSGKKLWFYGWGRERFRCGLIGWRLGNRGGLKEWWTGTLQKPLNPYDSSRFFDTWNDAPPYEGPNGVIPTLGLEETTAGRLDFLYLATLDLWVKRAEKANTPEAKKVVAEAKQFIVGIKRRVKPDYYFYYRQKKQQRGTGVGRLDYRNKEKIFNWPVGDYVKVRRQAANLITKLKAVAK